MTVGIYDTDDHILYVLTLDTRKGAVTAPFLVSFFISFLRRQLFRHAEHGQDLAFRDQGRGFVFFGAGEEMT